MLLAAVLININKLFLDIGTCLYIYVCMYVYIILLNSHDYLKKTSIKINVATDEGNNIVEMKLDTEQTMKLEYLYKVGSECNLNSWPDSSVS